MATRPNVLVVLSDQHRAMATAPDGNPDVETPTMERLAADGVHCPNAYANTPVCTPSRGTFLTGQYPHRHGALANDLPLRSDVRTVGEAFQAAGYRTGWIGKWHLDGVPREKFTPPGPRRQGFDHWAAYNCHLDFFDGHYYRDGAEPEHFDDYEPIALTDLAIEFLETRRGADDPFFLVVSPHPPHSPYEDVPQRYRDRYDPADLTLRPNAEPIPNTATSIAGDRDPRETLAGYYAHVTAVDEQLGRLVEWVDDAGVAEDTAICHTSDHGDMLFSQGNFAKGQPYEEAINVPFFLRYPGEIPAGAERDALLSVVDLAPTLCSLAGIDDLPEAQGTDLAPVLRGVDDDAPESVYLGIPKVQDQSVTQGLPEWRGVRTERYTYARLQDGTPWVLFDDEADPHQRENLALDADRGALLERLDDEVDRWVERTDDPDVAGEAMLRGLDLTEAWNERERTMHAEDPDLVSEL